GKYRRNRENVVGTEIVRAVGILIASLAAAHPDVLRRLEGPQDFPGRHVERHDRVARLRVRLGIGVARRDVNRAPAGVDGWSSPDAGAPGAPELDAVFVFLA